MGVPAVATSVLVEVVVGAAATAGEGLALLFDELKKPPNLAGDADAVGAGEASVAVFSVFFLRVFFAGEALASGEALVAAAGDALAAASVFLRDLCLAGDGEGEGDSD